MLSALSVNWLGVMEQRQPMILSFALLKNSQSSQLSTSSVQSIYLNFQLTEILF